MARHSLVGLVAEFDRYGVDVAIGEQGAAGSESIDIRRDGVGMAIETADPVVHVVDRDKENVGASFVSVCRFG